MVFTYLGFPRINTCVMVDVLLYVDVVISFWIACILFNCLVKFIYQLVFKVVYVLVSLIHPPPLSVIFKSITCDSIKHARLQFRLSSIPEVYNLLHKPNSIRNTQNPIHIPIPIPARSDTYTCRNTQNSKSECC